MLQRIEATDDGRKRRHAHDSAPYCPDCIQEQFHDWGITDFAADPLTESDLPSQFCATHQRLHLQEERRRAAHTIIDDLLLLTAPDMRIVRSNPPLAIIDTIPVEASPEVAPVSEEVVVSVEGFPPPPRPAFDLPPLVRRRTPDVMEQAVLRDAGFGLFPKEAGDKETAPLSDLHATERERMRRLSELQHLLSQVADHKGWLADHGIDLGQMPPCL